MAESFGLSRHQLEREMAWLMRQAPGDPARAVDLLTTAVITLIDKNNAAIAKAVADASRPDLPERH